ncbi:matrix metalloproteinase-9-like isoform X1 [Oculina patagonica]
MMYAYVFVLVCLCRTLPACWAGSKHQKEFLTKSGIPGKENLIESDTPVDEFDSNECSVKTVDGKCCEIPFLYLGKNVTSCVPGLLSLRKWCVVSEKEKTWGWCPSECSVKTVDGKCCHFPFLYKGIEQTSCVKSVTTNRKWCGVTYNYDKEKKWGWCPSECSVKTVDGKCCKFPFLYKGIEQTSCVKTGDKKWCGVTYNYEKEKKWGWCPLDIVLPSSAANIFLWVGAKPSFCSETQRIAENLRETRSGSFSFWGSTANLQEECCAEGCNTEEIDEVTFGDEKIAEQNREKYMTQCC